MSRHVRRLRRSQTAALGLSALLLLALGSRVAAAERSDAAYVSAPFVGLLEGIFDGEVTLGELTRHGDLGLGALDASDGELILLDGQLYRARGDGSVVALASGQRTPFAMATFFDVDRRIEANASLDMSALRALLDREMAEPSVPYAFRIEGEFAAVTTRSVNRQSAPYRRLVEVVREQILLELKDVSGTILGFRMPDYSAGLSIPGYHFHFLSADRKTGGHLLAFRANRLRIEADRCSALEISVPRSPAFSRVRLSPVSQAEIDQILGTGHASARPRQP